MSRESPPAADSHAPTATDSTDATGRAERVARHLRDRLRHEGGPLYVKSRFLVETLGYTSKEMGATMRRLAERERPPSVEPWAYSGGTTWQVTPE
jgi:hypothetical protein